MGALKRRTTGQVRKILPLHLMFKDMSKQTEQYRESEATPLPPPQAARSEPPQVPGDDSGEGAANSGIGGTAERNLCCVRARRQDLGGSSFPHPRAERRLLGTVKRERFPLGASSPNLLLTYRRATRELGKHSWKLH